MSGTSKPVPNVMPPPATEIASVGECRPVPSPWESWGAGWWERAQPKINSAERADEGKVNLVKKPPRPHPPHSAEGEFRVQCQPTKEALDMRKDQVTG